MGDAAEVGKKKKAVETNGGNEVMKFKSRNGRVQILQDVRRFNQKTSVIWVDRQITRLFDGFLDRCKTSKLVKAGIVQVVQLPADDDG